MPDSFFEFVDPSGAAVDPTGLWAARIPTISFEAGAAPAETVPVWRVNLSADAGTANETFRQAEEQLEAARRALESVPQRLEGYVRRSQAGSAGQVSFAIEDQAAPEAELTGLLDEYHALESGQVSFGVREDASRAWEQAKAGFEALTQSINREVLHFAWVETSIDGEPLARTSVGWGGDSQTFYLGDITPEEIVQHSRTLGLASASRSLKLRMFTTIMTGAVKLSTLLASGGGAVLALPLAYQYVTKILAQVKEYQALQ